MEKTPKISVIMPAYNMEQYIETAIRSVMVQTFADWELLVLDDRSRDRTCAIVESLAAEDDRIRLIRMENNSGVAKVRNRGFELSRGEFIALLDSDDTWLPKKLETQLARLGESGADFTYCSYGIIDEEGKLAKNDYIVPERVDFEHLLRENVIGCSTVMLRRELVERYRFDAKFYHEDYVLWLQLLQAGFKAVGCTEVLSHWRYIKNSRSYNKAKSARNRWIIYRQYLKLPFWKSVGVLHAYTVAGMKKYMAEPARRVTVGCSAIEKRAVTVSVVMPAYNAQRYIEQSIRSVMTQTFEDWELLVVDDGSKDDTCAVVEKLITEDSRIRLLKNETNMGVASTRNRGFDCCGGQYVALLDSDDVWRPEKLEQQLALAQQTGANVIYCSYGIVDANGKKICDDFIVPETTDFDMAMTKSVISCSTALLDRSIVDNYRFSSEFYHEDLALWLDIMKDGNKACGVKEVLADYRVMEGTRASNKLRTAYGRWQIYRGLLHLSVFESVQRLYQYMVLGLKKYRRL